MARRLPTPALSRAAWRHVSFLAGGLLLAACSTVDEDKTATWSPNRIYAAQWTDWHGQVVQRSNDGGASWEPVGNEFAYQGDPGTHQFYDGTPHPWDFKRVWHFEPSPTELDTVFAGVEDAALFPALGSQSAALRKVVDRPAAPPRWLPFVAWLFTPPPE